MPQKLVEMLRHAMNSVSSRETLRKLMLQAQICQEQARAEEAVHLYDRVIAANASNPEPYYKRANALSNLHRWQDAIADYDQAIKLDPEFANAYCNRGHALERERRWQDALNSYDCAIALNPNDSLAHYNRGCLLVVLSRLPDAVVSFDQAIVLRPDFTQAYANRGNALQELRHHEAAIQSYDQALKLDPNLGEVIKSRGVSHQSLKNITAAITDYEAASAITPESAYLLGIRRHAQNQICDWENMDADLSAISAGLKNRLRVCTPFALLSMTDSLTEQRQAAEIWTRDTCPAQDIPRQMKHGLSTGIIRLGYFSADFRDHPVSQLTVRLFELHNRSKFEIFAFSFGPHADDAMRDRLKRTFDNFFEVGDKSSEEIALMSRDLKIDIAVDLGGFTEYSRTSIFAYRAAPLQINFLGYPGTMAAPYMDYIVGDTTVIPADKQDGYTEKVIYLPNSFLPTDSSQPIAETRYERAEFGLPPSGFVFCCFNNSYKILPETFDSWMRILGRVPNSVLWLSYNHPRAAKNLHDAAAKRGINAARIIFAERITSLPEHLARLQLADLFLNTHPYNAHATAIDCLWAGLPMVTRLGHSFASRVSASLLNVLELPELIADTQDDYVRLATDLALDESRMHTIKSKLNQNRHISPLFDTMTYVTNLESALEAIQRRHLAGLAPENIIPARNSPNESI